VSCAYYVPGNKKQAVEREIRQDSSPQLAGLPPCAVNLPGERPGYHVLTYIEPLKENVVALGLDLAGDPIRRSAVERARESMPA